MASNKCFCSMSTENMLALYFVHLCRWSYLDGTVYNAEYFQVGFLPINQSVSESVGQSVGQPSNISTNQSISIDQSINQSDIIEPKP